MSAWYDNLRVDQQAFLKQLTYNIKPSMCDREYLDEMLRTLVDVCDQLEKDWNESQNEVEEMQDAVQTERDRLASEFHKDAETLYTGSEIAGMLWGIRGKGI